MALPPETCDQCGFDSSEYGLQDALGTLRAIPPMLEQTVEGADDAILVARPAPSVWSVAEYTAHTADVIENMGRLLHGILTVDGLEVEAIPEGHAPDVSDGFGAALVRVQANAARLHRRAVAVGPARDPRWKRTAVAGGETVDAARVLRHAIHDATHHLSDIGRGLHALGAGPPTHEGRVEQINVSDGGVPKRPVAEVEVGRRGLTGDRQAARKHHGRPLQALCLWSSEVIAALAAEGHPIGPGSAGENLTLAGVDWSQIRPGVRLQVGSVLAEMSAWSTPCKKNAQWFKDGDFNRMGHDRHPGWSRAYAWVRRPGVIRTGDEVVVEP